MERSGINFHVAHWFLRLLKPPPSNSIKNFSKAAKGFLLKQIHARIIYEPYQFQ